MLESDAMNRVCPQCGFVNADNATSCGACGHVLTAGPPPRPPAVGRFYFLYGLGALPKIALVLATIALPAVLLYLGAGYLHRVAVDTNPYPTDPAETAAEFFNALYLKDYQRCYNLFASSRKAAVIIGQQSRYEGYWPHYRRIRNYLVQRAADNFVANMQIDPTGTVVTFDNGIVLTVRFLGSTGMDKKLHYTIEEINEFPIDVAPGLGVEEYNRRLDQMIDGIESPGQMPETPIDYDDLGEILGYRPEDTKYQREQRLIAAVKKARQLDVRHSVLECLIREYRHERATRRLLTDLTYDPQEVPQLRQLARRALEAD